MMCLNPKFSRGHDSFIFRPWTMGYLLSMVWPKLIGKYFYLSTFERYLSKLSETDLGLENLQTGIKLDMHTCPYL